MLVCACVCLREVASGLLGRTITTVPPPQQTSEPSYPDIILIAINRHGVLLIHPKTKVAAGPQRSWGSCQGPGTPAQVVPPCPSIPPVGSGGPQSSSSDSGPLGPLGFSWFLPSLPPGTAHHLPLHQDLQLEQWQHLLPHGSGEPGPGQPLAM